MRPTETSSRPRPIVVVLRKRRRTPDGGAPAALGAPGRFERLVASVRAAARKHSPLALQGGRP